MESQASLREQAKGQVLGSLTRARGMCGKQESHPRRLPITHFHPPCPKQQPCPRCWAPELNTWHHSMVSGTSEEFISWTKQPKSSAPLFASMVQSEPTFSNGAGEEQLKMDSGRVSAEEKLKGRAFQGLEG